MKIRYTFRAYPNEQQRIALSKDFGVSRYAYNFALNWWGRTFKEGGKPNYNKASAEWTKERHRTVWALENSCVPPQQAIRHLQVAFVNFFDKRSKYPRFKKKSGKQSAEYTSKAFKYNSQNRLLTLSKVGQVKVVWSRVFQSIPTTVTITKSCSGKYFVTLCLDEPDKIALPKTTESIGIDFGINRLATLSNGETVSNPRYLAANLSRLAKAQKILSRRTKGSNRWKLQKIKVARIHEHVANCRKDNLDKFSLNMVKRFDTICIEDLHVRGMVRNRKLARSLSDASFGMARSMLEYKSEWYGKELAIIDRFFPSSKTCNECSYIVEKLPLNIREWTCPECKKLHDRDVNAAKNILAVGHTVKGRGLGVRPKRDKSLRGNQGRSVKLSSENVCA